jgi:hypothetical protein
LASQAESRQRKIKKELQLALHSLPF